jgi:hypothetical protein
MTGFVRAGVAVPRVRGRPPAGDSGCAPGIGQVGELDDIGLADSCGSRFPARPGGQGDHGSDTVGLGAP